LPRYKKILGDFHFELILGLELQVV